MAKILQFPRRGTSVDARNARVEHFLYVVRPIAAAIHKLRPPSFDLEDLIATGNLALVQAADSFDQSLNVPFEAWAKMKVRGAILDATRRKPYRDSTHDEIHEWHAEMRDQRPTAEETMLAACEVRTIRECIDQLPNHMKAVIVQRYTNGCTLGEIARSRGVGNSHGITELHRSAIREVKLKLVEQGVVAPEPPEPPGPQTDAEIMAFVKKNNRVA